MNWRAATRARLPLVDALIAAGAKWHGAILAHCGLHLAVITKSLARQLMLPPKQ